MLSALAMLLAVSTTVLASPSAVPPERTRALQARVMSNPLDALAHNELGVALAGSGDLIGAQRHLWLAVIADDTLIDAWANLAMAQRKGKNHQEAIAAFGKALTLKPSQHEVWYSAGASLRALKQNDASMFALQTFLKHAPKAHPKRSKVARILAKWRKEGMTPAAPKWPQPRPPAALVAQIGQAIAEASQPPQAPETVARPAAPTVLTPSTQSPFEPPSSASALPTHGGDGAIAAKRYVEALRNYESEVVQRPDDGVLLYKIGATRAILGDPTGALRAWRRVLRQAPERLILNRQIAFATRRLADWGMVETTRATPKDLLSTVRRALMAKDPADALLLTEGTEDAELLLLRGEAALRLGQLDIARKAFGEGLAISPDDHDLRAGKIEVMIHGGKPEAEEAAQEWMDDMQATTAAFLAERALVVARRIQYGTTASVGGDEFDEDLE